MTPKCRHVWRWSYTHSIPNGVKQSDGHYRMTDQIYECTEGCGRWMMSADFVDDELLKSERYVTV